MADHYYNDQTLKTISLNPATLMIIQLKRICFLNTSSWKTKEPKTGKDRSSYLSIARGQVREQTEFHLLRKKTLPSFDTNRHTLDFSVAAGLSEEEKAGWKHF